MRWDVVVSGAGNACISGGFVWKHCERFSSPPTGYILQKITRMNTFSIQYNLFLLCSLHFGRVMLRLQESKDPRQ